MTSSKLMAQVLKKMPDEPAPMKLICTLLDRTEGNVRHILADMEELGLVEQVEISIPDQRVKYGWKKTVHKRSL